MRKSDQTKDSLNRPEGNDMYTNYTKHDVGERHVKILLEAVGLETEAWGINRPEEEDDRLIFDDKMDLKVFDGDEFVGIIEVKTKTNPRYLGSMNKRHFEDYKDVAAEHDVPVFIVFLHVDGERVLSSRWTQVTPDMKPSRAFVWPDGNEGVEIPETHLGVEVIDSLKFEKA